MTIIEGGEAKDTLPGKQKKAKPNESEDFRRRKDEQTMNDSSNDDGDQVDFQSSKANILKYTLNSNQAAQQTESKPNTVETGEVNQQPRRVYRHVANNFRFRKKYDVLSDKIDKSDQLF